MQDNIGLEEKSTNVLEDIFGDLGVVDTPLNGKEYGREYRKQWRETNKIKYDAGRKVYLQEWRENNPDKVKIQQKTARENSKNKYIGKKSKLRLKRKYGLTPESLEGIKKYQNYQCAICGKEKKLNIDHCHKENKVRGLLCTNCNILIGHAKENIEILKLAIDYLNKWNK